MTKEEVYEMIKSTGLPCAYYQFNVGEAPELPYIVYYYPQSADVMADNINYVDKEQLAIELYTQNKDFDVEKTVEDVLKAHGLAFAREEQYIDDEKMYEILYLMEVYING